jgi:hypothetical protein
MIPFVYLFLLIQEVGNKVILLAKPIERSSETQTGSFVVLAILAMTLIGLVLSLTRDANLFSIQSRRPNT